MRLHGNVQNPDQHLLGRQLSSSNGIFKLHVYEVLVLIGLAVMSVFFLSNLSQKKSMNWSLTDADTDFRE